MGGKRQWEGGGRWQWKVPLVGGRRQWEVPLVGGRRQWETEWEGSRAGGTGAVGEARIGAGEGDGSGREMVVGWFEVNSSRNDKWEAPGV